MIRISLLSLPLLAACGGKDDSVVIIPTDPGTDKETAHTGDDGPDNCGPNPPSVVDVEFTNEGVDSACDDEPLLQFNISVVDQDGDLSTTDFDLFIDDEPDGAVDTNGNADASFSGNYGSECQVDAITWILPLCVDGGGLEYDTRYDFAWIAKDAEGNESTAYVMEVKTPCSNGEDVCDTSETTDTDTDVTPPDTDTDDTDTTPPPDTDDTDLPIDTDVTPPDYNIDIPCFFGSPIAAGGGTGTCADPIVIDISAQALGTSHAYTVALSDGEDAADFNGIGGACPVPPVGTARDLVFEVTYPGGGQLDVSVDAPMGSDPRITVLEFPNCSADAPFCIDSDGPGICEGLRADQDLAFHSNPAYVVISEVNDSGALFTVQFEAN